MIQRIFLVSALIFLQVTSALALEPKWENFLTEIVNQNSGTENLDGVNKVSKKVAQELKSLGFRVTFQDLEEGRRLLIAQTSPTTSKKLALIGHIDTVFSPEADFQKITWADDRVTGPGVIDMKGGIVVMLSILSRLSQDEKNQILILINPDEEIGGHYSKVKLREALAEIPYALVLEPGLPDGSVIDEQSGLVQIKVSAVGKASHAGIDFYSGVNACAALSQKIGEILNYAAKVSDEKFTVNLGLMKGGTKANVVCENAQAVFDIRYIDQKKLDRFLRQVGQIVNAKSKIGKSVNNSVFSLDEVNRSPVLAEVSTDQLLKILQSTKSGANILGKHAGYVSDANKLSSAYPNTQFLVGLGPYGGGMHSGQEFGLRKSFDERAELLFEVIKKVTGPQPTN